MTTTPIRSKTKKIELLSPAKDLATAIAAIDHGADAVYIGADDFSARSAAANDIADISSLAEYAHRYRARVYITLNTIIYDSELERVREMVYRLHEAGADALIVQDMALLEMELPPIELHASTQCDIRDAAKAIFLHEAGFTRVVAARETPVSSLREMASAGVEVEAFVHGALCVCYSGQCYMSQAFASRSANRGRCAQICRLPYELTDIQGRKITQSSALHALSLKDMNRSDYLGDMVDAGVTSFKIEGRLKDASYVKNITAWYRKKLDEAINSREGFSRSSDGIHKETIIITMPITSRTAKKPTHIALPVDFFAITFIFLSYFLPTYGNVRSFSVTIYCRFFVKISAKFPRILHTYTFFRDVRRFPTQMWQNLSYRCRRALYRCSATTDLPS